MSLYLQNCSKIRKGTLGRERVGQIHQGQGHLHENTVVHLCSLVLCLSFVVCPLPCLRGVTPNQQSVEIYHNIAFVRLPSLQNFLSRQCNSNLVALDFQMLSGRCAPLWCCRAQPLFCFHAPLPSILRYTCISLLIPIYVCCAVYWKHLWHTLIECRSFALCFKLTRGAEARRTYNLKL